MNGGVDRAQAHGLTTLGDLPEGVMRNQVVDGTNQVTIEVPRGAATVEQQDLEPAAIESSPAAAKPDEILTRWIPRSLEQGSR